MHKLESFALSSNAKIDRPLIQDCFYPIVEDKYICVSNSSNEQSKKYDYFDDVIFHIKPFLDKENIQIAQIGGGDDTKLFYCKHYFNTNRLQNSYIIDKSLLYFGNYNLYANIASHKDKPIVCPSNLDYADSFFPYWSNDTDCNILMPDLKDQKPSNSPNEPNKTINKVYPEKISAHILDLLGIKHNLDKIQTVHIGENYASRIAEIVPSLDFDPRVEINGEVAVRMDKSFVPQALPAIAQNRSLAILTEEMIDINLLKSISSSIKNITFIVKAKTKKSDIDQLASLGKPLTLVSRNKNKIEEIRLKFIDYDIGLVDNMTKSDAGIKSVTKNMKFLSRKNIISGGHIYNSYLAEEKKSNVSEVEDSKLLWEDVSFLRIFKDNT